MIVIDANVAIKWIIKQPLRERALAVLTQPDALAAPAMFVAEVTTAIWQYVRAGQIAIEQARQGLAAVLGQVTAAEDDAELAGDALAMGLELGHAPYDCFYLALAIREDARLVTADRRFVNRLAPTAYSSRVIHLSDWN
jgi:predicted nucleic acid-binding protein